MARRQCREKALPLGGRTFQRIEAGIGRYFARVAKATDWLQRVHQTKCRQETNAGVRAQATEALISLALLLQPEHRLQQSWIERLE